MAKVHTFIFNAFKEIYQPKTSVIFNMSLCQLEVIDFSTLFVIFCFISHFVVTFLFLRATSVVSIVGAGR